MPGFKRAVWHAQFLKEEKWKEKLAFGNWARRKNQQRKYRASKIKIYNLQATESKDLQPLPHHQKQTIKSTKLFRWTELSAFNIK